MTETGAELLRHAPAHAAREREYTLCQPDPAVGS